MPQQSAVDYDALAEQVRGGSGPATDATDYDSLASQARNLHPPAPPPSILRPEQVEGLTPTVKTGQGPAPGAPVPQMTDAMPVVQPHVTISEHLGNLSKTLRQSAQQHEQDFLHRAATGGPPPSYWEQRVVDDLYQGSSLANMASGATSPTGVGLAAVSEIPVIGPIAAGGAGAILSLQQLLKSRQPGETQADALQRHMEAIAGLFGSSAAVGKGVTEMGPGVRSVTRNLVGRSPGEVAEAEAKAGEEAAGVQAKNQAATEKAQLQNQTDVSKAQGKYNEALAEHEGSGAELDREHQQALAEWEQENEQGRQKVETQRAQETAKQQQRQKLLDESDSHSAQVGPALDALERKIGREISESYQEVGGEADPGDIAERMKAAAENSMKEHGPIPGPIQRMISRYTPAEESGLEGGEGEEGPGLRKADMSDTMLEQMYEQGIFLPEEEAAVKGEGATAAKASFANLHSQYSALGKMAAQTADRFQRSAYLAAQDVVRQSMKELTDAEGPESTKAFQESQARFKQYARTFLNRSSPVARALAKYREVVGSLQDNPKANEIAGHFVRDELTRGGKFNYARELLGQFEGAPTDTMDAMKGSLDQANSLPSKPKVVADYVPKPQPQRGEVGPPPVYEQPVPAHTAELTPPPEPFNRSEFIKEGMTEKGRQMQHLSPFEVSAPAFGLIGAAGELARGEPMGALGSAAAGAAIPAARYGVGALLQHPGFQDWVAREPGAPLGTPGARGNPTPFTQAPPSSPTGPSAPSGAGPSTTPGGGIQALQNLRDMVAAKGGDPGLLAQMDARIKDLKFRTSEAGDVSKAPGGVERRGQKPSGGFGKPTATMEVPPEVASKIKAAGLVSKGEVMPGSGVYQVEHPDHPGKTFSIHADDTPQDIARKVAAWKQRFGL